MKKILGTIFLVFTSLFAFSVLSFETGDGKTLISKTIGMAEEMPRSIQSGVSFVCQGASYIYTKVVGAYLGGEIAIAKTGKVELKKFLDTRVRKIHLTAYLNFRSYRNIS